MYQTKLLLASSKKIGYFLEPHHSIVEWDSWVDCPLAGLHSKEIGHFLVFDHTVDEWVDSPLAGLESKEIGYFLVSDYTIDEWVDLPLMGLEFSEIGYFLESDHTFEVVLGFY